MIKLRSTESAPQSTARLFSDKVLFTNAFSLVELLVTVAVVGILASLGYGAFQSSVKSSTSVKELAAAKTLIAAYMSHAAENSGKFLPGYDRTVQDVTDKNGEPVGSPPAWRYPFRLAPYFDYRIRDIILVNDNAKKISESDAYTVSAYPAFGINQIFVGGDVQENGSVKYAGEAIMTQGQACSVIVFATASGDGRSGYCTIGAPRETGRKWSSQVWSKSSNPADFGNVDARHNDKAICAFLDGSVRSLGVEELKDMRLWSRQALAQSNPNYSITQTAPGGR